MDRFYGRVVGGRAFVENGEFKHFKVKRVRIGDTVEVLDENFQPYLCKVVEIERKRARLEVLEKLEPRRPKISITLYQCVPVKLSTFDDIVEMASQAGAERIVPVVSERSFQKISVLKEKLKRWQTIARESVKQCGRHQPLIVDSPVRLEDLKEVEGLKIFPFERGALNICSFLEDKKDKKAAIVIGPEGGFSKREAEFLTSNGWHPVSLGDFILKAQTAAAVSVSTVYNALLKHHAE